MDTKILKALLLFMMPAITQTSLQGQDAGKLASDIINSYSSHVVPVKLLKEADKVDAKKMVDAFTPFTGNPVPYTRLVAFQMIHRQVTRRGDSTLKKQTVRFFTKSMDDKDAAVSSLLIDYLHEYSPADFDPETRYIITQRAKEKKTGQNKVILLSGYLDINELLYNFRQMYDDKSLKDKRVRLSLLMAMTRMGDTTATKDLLGLARELPVNDDWSYDLCPNLAYTCQKQIYNLLFDIILSDQKDCLSANPDNEKPVICAFRVIECIAPYLKDFPISLDSSGDADIQDYPSALEKVRGWIKSHRDSFEFNKEKY